MILTITMDILRQGPGAVSLIMFQPIFRLPRHRLLKSFGAIAPLVEHLLLNAASNADRVLYGTANDE